MACPPRLRLGEGLHFKIALLPKAMKVDPQLLVGIKPHTGIVLAVESVQRPTHYRVQPLVRHFFHPLGVLEQDGNIGAGAHAPWQASSCVPNQTEQIDISRSLGLEQEVFTGFVAWSAIGASCMLNWPHHGLHSVGNIREGLLWVIIAFGFLETVIGSSLR
jgi:hypothetical protein